MSFEDDIAAIVDAVGLRSPAIVYELAMAPWKSDTERDDFLALITGKGGEDG